MISVDANPLQNHLLELKIAAIRALDRNQFLGFSGVTECAPHERWERYCTIRESIPAEAREFWDLNRKVIERGWIYSGAHETFYRRLIGPLIRTLRPRRTRQLFAFDDLEEQARFYSEKWDHAGWRLSVRLLAQPLSMRLLLGDPSYFAQVSRDEGFARYLLARLRNVFERHLARDNDVFQLYVLGRYRDPDVVPLYLSPTTYDVVRANIDRITVQTVPIDSFLAELPTASVDRLSLSDISGWMSQQTFEQVLSDAVRVCRPGGRVCYRNFLADRPWPSGALRRCQ